MTALKLLKVLSCSLCLAGLQERVLYVPGFRYTGEGWGFKSCGPCALKFLKPKANPPD